MRAYLVRESPIGPPNRGGTGLSKEANMRLCLLTNKHHSRLSVRGTIRRIALRFKSFKKTILRFKGGMLERRASTKVPQKFIREGHIKIQKRGEGKTILIGGMGKISPRHPVLSGSILMGAPKESRESSMKIMKDFSRGRGGTKARVYIRIEERTCSIKMR